MRILLTVLAFMLTLCLSAVLGFLAVLFLAGPHGGLLPKSAETLVLALGWLLVLLVPALVARVVWRRVGRSEST